jgi:flagellar FliL protein
MDFPRKQAYFPPVVSAGTYIALRRLKENDMTEQETQTQEEAIPENEAPPKAAKKGFLKTLIITLVILGLAAACGYYVYGKTLLANVQKHKTEKSEKDKVEIGPIIALEPFVINVSGNSSRFVKISVAMEVKDEKGVEQIKKMTPVIRDMMLSVLGTKAPEVFMETGGRNAIKEEMFGRVSQFMADGNLKAVYITDIVMQ